MYIGPNTTHTGILFGFDADNRSTRSYKGKTLLYDNSDWPTDSSQSTNRWSAWAGGNTRTTATDPWGNQSVVWKSSTENSTASRGGLYGKSVAIDNTKLYRISFWENRVTNNSATYGRYYLGCNGYGTTNGVGNLGSGTANTNPYFFSTSRNGVPIDTWVLVVGHIHPYNYTSTDEHADSGRWLQNGTNYSNISTDYMWLPQTTSARPRSLAIYQGNVAGMVHHTIHPRMDLCDGTEPSLDDLLNGTHHKLINQADKQEVNLSNMSFDSTEHPIFDGTDDSIVIANPGTSNTTGFTIEMIIKPDSYSNAPMIITPNSHGIDHYIRINTSGKIKMVTVVAADSTSQSFTSQSTLTAGENHHIIFTYDSVSGGRVYFNNELERSTSPNFTAKEWEGTWAIGQRGNSTYFFNGSLPILKVYNKVLTPNEIRRNFKAYKKRFNL